MPRDREACASWLDRIAGVTPALLLSVALLGPGCRSGGPVPASASAAPDEPAAEAVVTSETGFSGARAMADLVRLKRIGSRASGSRGARKARALLEKRLHEIGATLEAWPYELVTSGDREHSSAVTRLVSLMARLEGDSEDAILLAARYDTPRGGVDSPREAAELASGAALVLELARVLAQQPRLYTIWLAFIDGDGLGAAAGEATDALAPAAERFPGSAALALQLHERGGLERVRLAVFFDRVGAAGLPIARDLRSHGVQREVFWESARSLAADDVFTSDGAFESVSTGHLAFIESGLRRVVAISGRRRERLDLAEDEQAQPPAESSPQSLQVVGDVTLLALDRIAERLRRIDRFASSPLDPLATERDAPENSADESAGPATAGEDDEHEDAVAPPAATPARSER